MQTCVTLLPPNLKGFAAMMSLLTAEEDQLAQNFHS